MAAPMQSVFHAAVDRVLGSWTVLQNKDYLSTNQTAVLTIGTTQCPYQWLHLPKAMRSQLAVQHGFGGRDSQAKAAWMSEAISQWFSENQDIETDELEDFLTELLDNEFNTVADDGSLPEIARTICGYWRLCSTGEEAKVAQQIQHLPKPDLGGSRSQPSADSDDDDDDDDPTSRPAPTPPPNAANVTAPGPSEREETPMEEDDGWTVVPRKNKKK